MFKYWDLIIEPLLRAIAAKRIVEIGVADGQCTQLLIDYCTRENGHLDAIDPDPIFDFAAANIRHKTLGRFHQGGSLEVLPQLRVADVVLIDGDHNWYTVFNELKLLEAASQDAASDFPLVFFHDVSWPYGRRDLYYAPERLPGEHLQSHAQKGMLPGVSRLVDTGGLNAQLCNALEEGGAYNGVLTAVEDFLKQFKIGTLHLVPILFGLGILIPEQLQQNEALMAKIRHWQSVDGLKTLLGFLERERTLEMCFAHGEQARLNTDCHRLEVRVAELSNGLDIERKEAEQLRRERNHLQSDLQGLAASRSWRWTRLARDLKHSLKSYGSMSKRFVSGFLQFLSGRGTGRS